MSKVSAVPWYKTEGVLGQKFKTKAALTEAVRDVVNAAWLDTPLVGEPLAFVLDVLRHHPEWTEKSAAGVETVVVAINKGEHFRQRGFHLRHPDGTTTDISWVTAIAAEHKAPHALVADAARHAVMDQILACRDAQAGGVCSICGLRLGTETHVDHAGPMQFKQILALWLDIRGSLPALHDTGLHPVFADPEDAADWCEHHALWADLRLIHAEENLSAARKATS